MKEITKITSVPLQRNWTDRFALDLAMSLEGSGDKIPVLLETHGYTQEELQAFLQDPLFEQRVREFQGQLKEKGLTFKMKARVQAELLLDTAWDVIHHPDTGAPVKADLIKWMSKVAGFESDKGSGGNNNGVVININMGDPVAPPANVRIIDHE